MKWLQGNPVGIALAALSGLFLLLALGMAIVSTLPVAVEVADTGSENTISNDSILTAGKIGNLRDYQVINERPVFNESRLPVIEEEEVLDAVVEETSIAVKDAPDVRLTGVIITSSMKIASLSPAAGNLESVMAHEGESLIGEYVGWQVTTVNPRNVVLESLDGRKLELELLVHDATIKEPPKPVPTAPAEETAQNQTAPPEVGGDPDDEPLSRAEQIRQRIAERREELRREQDAQQANPNDKGGVRNASGAKNSRRARPEPTEGASAYQNAIQNKIRNSSKDKASDEKEDG